MRGRHRESSRRGTPDAGHPWVSVPTAARCSSGRSLGAHCASVREYSCGRPGRAPRGGAMLGSGPHVGSVELGPRPARPTARVPQVRARVLHSSRGSRTRVPPSLCRVHGRADAARSQGEECDIVSGSSQPQASQSASSTWAERGRRDREQHAAPSRWPVVRTVLHGRFRHAGTATQLRPSALTMRNPMSARRQCRIAVLTIAVPNCPSLILGLRQAGRQAGTHRIRTT